MLITSHHGSDKGELSTTDLLTLARQRDSATWSKIYTDHYDAIFRYLFGRLGRREEAEDLASQVFLEALKGIDSFSERGKPLEAWLFGIARNLANNQFRSERARGPSDAIEDVEIVDLKADIGDSKAISLDLINVVNGLTRDQRETLILRFYVGLSAREVGTMLGKSEQAVYALQVRALARLRHMMRKDLDEDRFSVRVAS